MRHPLRGLLSVLMPPLLLLLLVLAVWHTLTVALEIESFLLPAPLDVVRAGWGDAALFLKAGFRTGAAAVGGFLASLIVGCVAACLFAQSVWIRRSCYPYAIFLQTVPIVAIAPLIVVWCGYGMQSVILVSFIVSLFPIITSATTGLLSVDPDLLDLFRLYDARRLTVLWKLRLPSAVPYIVSGARTSSGLAVIGAIVGEFFTGYGSSSYGLGYLIMQSSTLLKTDRLFAAVFVSTLLGLAVFGAVSSIGTAILRHWYGTE
ncbi:Putative aliphatic sulfonates transport permease protein SsuC [Maioricimonas rarisocia]|uniref:Aliphatic sulfonates transport permease protein SsuC n=1 Tax=Maioricimonas rarisocia TaxID=2528026 RepID=A0A517Z9J8_9PLAN|nr:ABC transporter permease [Maioricimonas rarisocia]QDU39158.1 Putative aliphatic sulfonates transport permease protein SsuC [Maioricimonas rarisocia]